MNAHRILSSLIGCMLAGALCVSPCGAVMLPLSTDELVAASDVIVRGKVLSTKGVWTSNKDAIMTHVYVNVIDVLRGELRENTIVERVALGEGVTNPVIIVEHTGGEIDGVGMGTSEAPRFTANEEVILFLKAEQSRVVGTVYVTVGEAQGKYAIDENDIAHKEGFTLLLESENDKALIDNNIPAADLLNKIGAGHAFIYLDRKNKKQQPNTLVP